MYNTKIMTQIWNSPEAFVEDLNDSFASESITNNSKVILANLMYAKYGNSPIANNDEYQFKAKVYSVVFRFGPSWEKKLELQKKLRNLTDEELLVGSKSITNHAYNPSTIPSTSALEELTEINEQNANITKRSKLESYALLYTLIENDVTTEFINRFSECFKQFVMPECTILYEGDE